MRRQPQGFPAWLAQIDLGKPEEAVMQGDGAAAATAPAEHARLIREARDVVQAAEQRLRSLIADAEDAGLKVEHGLGEAVDQVKRLAIAVWAKL